MKKVLILFCCLLLIGCSKKEEVIEDTKEINLSTKLSETEVYSDLVVNDIINIENEEIELLNGNEVVDTTKLGKNKVKVRYKYNGKSYEYISLLEVKDTTPPLVFSGTNKYVNVGYSGNLCDLLTYGDNYSGEISCQIDGTYDLNTVGKYNLVYSLSDENDNVENVDVTLNVTEPSTETQTPSTKKTYFKDIYSKHKKDNTEIGLDISEWQGDVDYEKVKAEGVSFVMLRIGFEGSKTRELKIDAEFKENIKKAQEAGLKVGVYLYTIADSKEKAIKHADWVIDTLDGAKLDLPIAFDWENWGSWNSYKLSFYEINQIANTFIKRVEEKGYKGMLYSSKFYLETIWTNKINAPVWLAHYTDETSYKGDYNIWQLCNNGKINGIYGDVDINIMYN